MATKKIATTPEELTNEQRALIPEYKDRYFRMITSTERSDRAKAEQAVIDFCAFNKIAKPNKVTWVNGPIEGVEQAALIATEQTDVKDLSQEDKREQLNRAGYGMFEAYWLSTFAYLVEVVHSTPEAEKLLDIVNRLASEVSLYWIYEAVDGSHSVCVMTEKPTEIHLDSEYRPHNDKGPAIAFADGTMLFGIHGENVPSLMDAALKNALSGNTKQAIA
jgi:hypothetical protein